MVERSRTTPVFILAGGEGERLIPLTEVKPKPAVSFGGTHQIIDFTLSNCINSGLRRIYVLTQYQREHLQNYVRESRMKMYQSFRWSEGDDLLCLPPVSGKRYRGTADAVFQNLPLVCSDSSDHVLIASGDHIYSMDYQALLLRHIASGADMTMAAVERSVDEGSSLGVLNVANGVVTRFREKPDRETLPATGTVMVNMGVYVFKKSALIEIADRATPMDTDFGRDIIPALISEQKVASYDFGAVRRNYWRDVGNLDSYYHASMDLLGPNPQFDLDADSAWPICALNDVVTLRTGGSRISRQASIGTTDIRRSIVSHGTCVEAGAVIENSVIMPGSTVGKDAHVRNTIVAEGASVPAGLRVGINAHADRSRYLVTPGGIVVVSPTSNLSRQWMISAGAAATMTAA